MTSLSRTNLWRKLFWSDGFEKSCFDNKYVLFFCRIMWNIPTNTMNNKCSRKSKFGSFNGCILKFNFRFTAQYKIIITTCLLIILNPKPLLANSILSNSGNTFLVQFQFQISIYWCMAHLVNWSSHVVILGSSTIDKMSPFSLDEINLRKICTMWVFLWFLECSRYLNSIFFTWKKLQDLNQVKIFDHPLYLNQEILQHELVQKL